MSEGATASGARLIRRILLAYLDWLGDVERELGGARG